MYVIAQDAEFDDPQPESALRRRERAPDSPKRPAAPQVPDVLAHTERDVHGRRLVKLRPRIVRDAVPTFPPGAFAPSSVAPEGQVFLLRLPQSRLRHAAEATQRVRHSH